MNVGTVLRRLVQVIAEEARNNPEFDKKLREVIQPTPPSQISLRLPVNQRGTRTSNRRASAILDPILVIKDGDESTLRKRLEVLSVNQLKDIIAQYGMDSDRLAMKWRKADRLIDRIVEVANSRAHKGEAFM